MLKKPEIGSHNYHFGLVGFPLGHSLSPMLHQAALKELGLAGDYSLFPVPIDSTNLTRFIEILNQIRNGFLNGVNITIPYKQTLIPLLDELTPVAQATGAVNTVFLNCSHLVGDNTDVAGFGLDLIDYGLNYLDNPGTALILGAGGAARAVVYALMVAGWKVTLSARRLSQAEILFTDLQRYFNPAMPKSCILSDSGLAGFSDKVDLIVNTTPVGMTPNINGSPWPVGLEIPPCDLVYDLVYNPQETSFLKNARQSGIATRNGLGMLVRQAAVAFERWTGKPAPFEAMWLSTNDFRNRS